MGGSGVPYPYVSNSEYIFAPTAMDPNNLVPTGDSAAQAQSLADTIRRASAWADRFCFGADMSAKGASLCATVSVETDLVQVMRDEIRLICDYKPVIALLGLDIGFSMSNLASVGQQVASQARFGRRTIFVPFGQGSIFSSVLGTLMAPIGLATGTELIAVWSYVNGYPHTYLTEPITAGQTTCTVQPTDGGTGLLGIAPGYTRMTIRDGSLTESFVVSAISGSTLTSQTPFANSHSLPVSPDFIPVTSLPDDVSNAVIFATTFLIKTRGDNSIVLEGLTEPTKVQESAGDEWADLTYAMHLLEPYRIRVKQGRR